MSTREGAAAIVGWLQRSVFSNLRQRSSSEGLGGLLQGYGWSGRRLKFGPPSFPHLLCMGDVPCWAAPRRLVSVLTKAPQPCCGVHHVAVCFRINGTFYGWFEASTYDSWRDRHAVQQ